MTAADDCTLPGCPKCAANLAESHADPDPEVERIAALCDAACNIAMKAWLKLPAEGRPDQAVAFWSAVARAVIADRTAQEPVTDVQTLMEVAAERDEARAKLGVVNARLYAVEHERDALQRRLADLAEVADERDAALREIARLRARFDTISTAQESPALSPAETLECAEEMLRRIAASAGLYLDATEAAAIVAELDRLRGAAKGQP